MKKKSFQILNLVCILAFTLTQNQAALANPVEGDFMTPWTTNYFGRFKIDLPSNSDILTDYKIFNEKIKFISKNGKKDINYNIEKNIIDLKEDLVRGKSTVYEKTIPLSNGSALVLSKRQEYYTLNVYLLTAKNTLYNMTATAISAENLESAIEKIRKLSDAIFFRRPQDAPAPGAFALEAGYTTLPNTYAKETIYMGAQIAGHPGTYVSLLTQRIVKKEDGLIQRFENPQNSALSKELKALASITKTLRKKERMIGNIKAEEVAVKALTDGKTFYNFQVEYQGTLKSNTEPHIALELGTHEKGSGFKSDDEALAFWDKVVDSLKPLP